MIFDREAYLKIRFLKSDLQFENEQELFIKDLRISFVVNKSSQWATNTANIRIWNLSDTTRAKLKGHRYEVSLYAGYKSEGGPQLLFIGVTNTVHHEFAQPDIITILECAEGERPLIENYVSISIKGKVSVRETIRYIASQAKLRILEFAPSVDRFYENGYAYLGPARETLRENASVLSLQLVVQNEKISFIPIGGTSSLAPFVISEISGMIGVPEKYNYRRLDDYRTGLNSGWRIKTALRPMVLAGNMITLDCKRFDIKGNFKVIRLRHQGDTYGDLWESNLEAEELGDNA